MKLEIECYEITVKMTIRKDYWKMEKAKMNTKTIKDRIQEGGIEVPIETISVEIKE